MISQPVSSILSVLHCPLGLANSRPVLSLMLSSHLFLCLPCLSTLSLCLARWFLPVLMNGRHVHTTAACVSLRRSGGLRVVRSLAGSWQGLPRWQQAWLRYPMPSTESVQTSRSARRNLAGLGRGGGVLITAITCLSLVAARILC